MPIWGPPSATIVLRKHQEAQTAQGLLLGWPMTDESLVFCHPDGSPLLPHSITHAWTRLVKNAGFKGIRLHDARHTHARLMLSQGVHPKIVQERLGHSTISMTLDTYSHVLPGLQEAAARRFDEGLARPAKTENRELVSSGLQAALAKPKKRPLGCPRGLFLYLNLARPAGFEPTTTGSEAQCSIH